MEGLSKLHVANIDSTPTLNFVWYVNNQIVEVQFKVLSGAEHYYGTVYVGEEGNMTFVCQLLYASQYGALLIIMVPNHLSSDQGYGEVSYRWLV